MWMCCGAKHVKLAEYHGQKLNPLKPESSCKCYLVPKHLKMVERGMLNLHKLFLQFCNRNADLSSAIFL